MEQSKGDNAVTDVTAEVAEPAQRRVDPIGLAARFAPMIFLVVLMTGFSILEPRFLTPLNLFNVLRQVSIYGLLAIGMTFVILTAGIDLSIGSIVAFAGLVAALIAKGGLANRFTVGDGAASAGFGWGLAALAAVLVGLAAGFLQGFAITRFKVPPFIVTLGGMSAFRGAALLFSDGGPISGFDNAFVWWGQGKIGPVPVPVLIFALFAVLAHVTLTSTRYGRQIYAVGGNPEAARLAGLNVRRVVLSVYMITGFFSGLGAFVLAARLNSAEAVGGTGYELTVIASVVIGGTSLFGGAGTIFGTVVGTILIGVLLNGLVLLDVSAYVQQIIIGVIIVLAVAFDTFAKSRRRAV
jgi:inositol transport system permease protein